MLGVGSLKFLAATSATKEHELSCWVLRYLLSGEQQLTSTTGFPISTVSSTFPLICQILLVSLKMWLRLRHAPISILQVAGGRKHVGSKWCCFSVCFLPPSPSHLFVFVFVLWFSQKKTGYFTLQPSGLLSAAFFWQERKLLFLWWLWQFNNKQGTKR